MSQRDVSPSPSRAAGAAVSSLTRLWRSSPDYRRLFSSRFISLLGDWFNLLAIIALLRAVGASSAGSTGAVIVMKILPAALVGPLAGVLADRFPRRALMIGADALRFVFVSAMFLTPLLPHSHVAYVMALSFLQTLAAGLSEPARGASLPNVVPADLLGWANVVGVLSWSVTYTLGAAAGGVVTHWFGWPTALAVDALSYLVSIALIWPLRLPPPPIHDRALDATALIGGRDMLGALSWAFGGSGVRRLFWIKFGAALCGSMTVILTWLATIRFPSAGPIDRTISILYGARGIGMGIGPLLAQWGTRESDRRIGLLVGVGFAIFGCGLLVLPHAGSPLAAALIVTVIALGESVLWTYSTVLLQRATPDRYRGRLLAADVAFCLATMSLVIYASGALLDHQWLGLTALLTVAGLIELLAAVVWMIATRELFTTPSRDERPLG